MATRNRTTTRVRRTSRAASARRGSRKDLFTGAVFVLLLTAGLTWLATDRLPMGESARVFIVGAVIGIGLWEIARTLLRPLKRRIARSIAAAAREV